MLIAIWLACHPASFASGSEETASTQELLAKGKQFYEAGQYDQARRVLQDLLKKQPTSWQAVYYLELIDKTVQQRTGRLVEALRVAELRMQQTHRAAREQQITADTRRASAAIRAPDRRSSASSETSALEPGPARPAAPDKETPAPRHKVGEVSLLVDGAEVALERPIVLRDGRPLLPLRDVAAARYASLLQLPDGRFRVVFPDGVIKEMTTILTEQEPMLTEEQVRDLFSVDTTFDPSQHLVSLHTPQPAAFQTSTIAKSNEELREEERIQTLATRAQQPPAPTGEIPDAARPSVQLKGTVSYGYRNPHIGAPDRSVVTSVTGRAYDFDVRGESIRRDRNGLFKHDYSYLNFSRPELFIGLFDQSTSLDPLRGQSERFNGLKVIRTWNPMTATALMGGETENTVSGPSGSVKYLGRLYEASQEFAPWDWFRLRSALLYLQNHADLPEQSGTTSFPRENLVSFTDLAVQPLTDWTLSGQLARATYHPDNGPKDVVGDWNWRVGSLLTKERYTFGTAYEFVGDRYASVGNPAVYHDYKGWNIFGNYRMTNAWSVSSRVLRYRNNVDDNPTNNTQENQALLLSSSYQFPWRHTATLTWDDFLTNPSGPDPGSSNRTDLYRLDYALPALFDSQLLLNAQHTRTRQPAASGSFSNTVGGSLFKGFLGGSNVYLSQQFTHSNFEADPDASASTTSLNATYQAHRNVTFSFSSAYSRQTQEAAKGTNTVSGSTGVRWQLFPETVLTSEYRVDSYNVPKEHGRWPKYWSMFFLITQSFHVSTPPAFGTIEGRVVQDLNANDLIDPDEPGIEEVVVRLAQGWETMTTSQGSFRFSQVVPGWQTVTVDPASLPASLALRNTEQIVEVRRRGRATVCFPAVNAASIRGRVFIDANGDGVFQETEEPLEGVAVILSMTEQFRRTNPDGSFLFDHLLPGSYILMLHKEDVPIGYALTSENAITVTVKAGEAAKEIPFAVRLLPELSHSL